MHEFYSTGISKYNTNHDENGRFASGSGASTSVAGGSLTKVQFGEPTTTHNKITGGTLTSREGKASFTTRDGETFQFDVEHTHGTWGGSENPIDLIKVTSGPRSINDYSADAPDVTHGGYTVSYLDAQTDRFEMGSPAVIGMAEVVPEHQRKGIATAMLATARQVVPVVHSDMLTGAGVAWSSVVKYNQNHDEAGRFSTGAGGPSVGGFAGTPTGVFPRGKKTAEKLGVTEPELREATTAAAERIVADSDIMIATSGGIARMVQSGKTKYSAMTDRPEGGTFTHAGGPERRAIEQENFGIDIAAPDADRPVYGVLVPKGTGMPRSTADYGDHAMVLADAAKGRATFQMGDSGGGLSQTAPSKMSSPDLQSFDLGALDTGRIKRDMDKGTPLADAVYNGLRDYQESHASYIEVQIHGGVMGADVVRVTDADGETIAKYNQNHGSDGRFSSSGGAPSFAGTNPKVVHVTPGMTDVDASYRMSHRAPTNDGFSAQISNLSDGALYPADVLGPNGARLYGDGSAADKAAVATMKRVQGDPTATVTVYRAIDPKVSPQLNPGDWVTPSEAYARGEGANISPEDGKFILVSAEVPAGHLYTDANSLQEWGYDPATEVRKYNPNHDERGRFSTGDGTSDLAAEARQYDSMSAIQGDDGTVRLRVSRADIMSGEPEVTQPLEHIYRAISADEWAGIQANGHMKSDGRMNLIASEGTVATHRNPSFYLPADIGVEGRIVRMEYDPADNWRVDPADGYLKTDVAIPASRITAVSPWTVGTGSSASSPSDPQFHGRLSSGLRNSVSNSVSTAVSRAGYGPHAEALRGLSDFVYNGSPFAAAVRSDPSPENILGYVDSIRTTADAIGDFEGKADLFATLDATTALLSKPVQKFNPNHDEKGRFSTGSGSAVAPGLVSRATPAELKEARDSGGFEEHGGSTGDMTEADGLTGAQRRALMQDSLDRYWGDRPAGEAEVAVEALQQYVDASKLTIRANPQAVSQIIADGRYKNQHETGTSNGMLNPGRRSRMEETLNNVPFDSPAQLKPIYGYMSNGDRLNHQEGPSQYGSVKIVLKDAVKSRSTVTLGDSLAYDRPLPSPANKVDKYSIHPFADVTHGLDGPSTGEVYDNISVSANRYGQYVEAQIMGGVSLKDIEHVQVSVYSPEMQEWRAAGVKVVIELEDGSTSIFKYNENHDERGRFSSGAGGTGVAEPAPLNISVEAYDQKSAEFGQKVAAEAFTAIGNTHEAPNIQNVKIRVHDRSTVPPEFQKAEGWYTPADPGVINIQSDAHEPARTVVHEFGHMLDFEQFHGATGVVNVDDLSQSAMGRMLDSTLTTQGMNRIAMAHQMGGISDNGLSYMFSPPEVFARAYDQWVTTKNGSDQMRKELKDEVDSRALGQWGRDDFASVSKAMDDFFNDPINGGLLPPSEA